MSNALMLSNGKLLTFTYLNSTDQITPLTTTNLDESIGTLNLTLKSNSSYVYLSGVAYLDVIAGTTNPVNISLQILRNGIPIFAALADRPQISLAANTVETVAFPFEYVDIPYPSACSNSVIYEFILEVTDPEVGSSVTTVGTRTIIAAEIHA